MTILKMGCHNNITIINTTQHQRHKTTVLLKEEFEFFSRCFINNTVDSWRNHAHRHTILTWASRGGATMPVVNTVLTWASRGGATMPIGNTILTWASHGCVNMAVVNTIMTWATRIGATMTVVNTILTWASCGGADMHNWNRCKCVLAMLFLRETGNIINTIKYQRQKPRVLVRNESDFY